MILFYGAIAEYKGVDLLVEAFKIVRQTDKSFRLLIFGRPNRTFNFRDAVLSKIQTLRLHEDVITKFEFISDAETGTLFSLADCLVLPYRRIYQSGVMFLSYAFGLPVIATDVGSLGADIVDGETGILVPSPDPNELAAAIKRYFTSDMYRQLPRTREKIYHWAEGKYSWEEIGAQTLAVYRSVVGT